LDEAASRKIQLIFSEPFSKIFLIELMKENFHRNLPAQKHSSAFRSLGWQRVSLYAKGKYLSVGAMSE